MNMQWIATSTTNKLNTTNDSRKNEIQGVRKTKVNSKTENWKSGRIERSGKLNDTTNRKVEGMKIVRWTAPENPENWTPLYEDQDDAILLGVNTGGRSENRITKIENWENLEELDNRNEEPPRPTRPKPENRIKNGGKNQKTGQWRTHRKLEELDNRNDGLPENWKSCRLTLLNEDHVVDNGHEVETIAWEQQCQWWDRRTLRTEGPCRHAQKKGTGWEATRVEGSRLRALLLSSQKAKTTITATENRKTDEDRNRKTEGMKNLRTEAQEHWKLEKLEKWIERNMNWKLNKKCRAPHQGSWTKNKKQTTSQYSSLAVHLMNTACKKPAPG